MADPNFIVESRIITFDSVESVSVTFAKTHYGSPTVVVLPEADMRVYVAGITSTGCLIVASNRFSGNVHMQAVSRDPSL